MTQARAAAGIEHGDAEPSAVLLFERGKMRVRRRKLAGIGLRQRAADRDAGRRPGGRIRRSNGIGIG